MYHALLTNRYLSTRVIPLIAVAAVALCVALVIIVVSVMTGFLDEVKRSGRTLMGDVVISYPVSGIPHYNALLDELADVPEVAAATPIVDSYGLLKMPYPDGPRKQTETVQIWGIEPQSFAAVTGYDKTLYWQSIDDDDAWAKRLGDVVERIWDDGQEWLTVQNEAAGGDVYARPGDSWQRKLMDLLPPDQRPALDAIPSDPAQLRTQLPTLIGENVWEILQAEDPRLGDLSKQHDEGLTLRRSDQYGTDQPCIALGIHVSEANQRLSDGTYKAMSLGYWWMPNWTVTMTTLPIDSTGGLLEPESIILPVANEFVSGVFLIDDTRVMVPIELAQRMLRLDEAEILADDNETVIGVEPARATMILVRAADGVTPDDLRDAVADAYDRFHTAIMSDFAQTVMPPRRAQPNGPGALVQTWLQQQSRFIGPIEKERELMRTLFSLVYIVCAGLVLAIFWAIVYEKTRDIGILRSVGASRLGISWIFLRYGLVVGVGGAILGLGLAFLVVHNINAIHTAMGEPPLWLSYLLGALAMASLGLTIARARSGRLLPLVLGLLVTLVLGGLAFGIYWVGRAGGIVIWDPQVYYFSTIPNEMDMRSAVYTMIGAVVFSVIGAFLPAAKAADTDPVRALRYE
jgi:lipoprotein-releasing system permease protein